MAQDNPNKTAVFLETFALRSLVVKARLSGLTRSDFVKAAGDAWDQVPERLTAEGSPLRSFVDLWTSDDGPPNRGKPDGR